MDHLESLKFFVRVVEKKGISIGGRDFAMSPATASNRLKELEAYYEAKLINRTTRSISLTDEGRILYEQARNLIDEAENLKRRIKRGAMQISGPIKLAAPQDFGRNRIAPLLDTFIKRHPGVKIDLQLEDSNIDLIHHGIDLAVRLGQFQDSSLKGRKLCPNRRIVCASPTYLKTNGIPTHPTQLDAHNCLIMHWGPEIDREWAFKIKGRKHVITVSGNRSANNGAQVKDWCLKGYGIAYKSIWDVKEHLEKGELVELLSTYHLTSDSAIQLLYPGGYRPSRRVRKLIDYLAECFDETELEFD